MQIALGSIGEMQKVPILCALAHDQGISNAEISPKHQGITEASLAKPLKDHSNKASLTNSQILPHSCLLRDRPYQQTDTPPRSEFYSQATTCKQAHHSHTTNFPQPKKSAHKLFDRTFHNLFHHYQQVLLFIHAYFAINILRVHFHGIF